MSLLFVVADPNQQGSTSEISISPHHLISYIHKSKNLPTQRFEGNRNKDCCVPCSSTEWHLRPIQPDISKLFIHTVAD